MVNCQDFYWKHIREPLRLNPQFSAAMYIAQSAIYSNFGTVRKRIMAIRKGGVGNGVALCCRIRDEARYLAEFVQYYSVCGVDHFFFYEKLSTDNFRTVLAPYIEQGLVTLFADWPHSPVSPSAEHDCVLRSAGRFQWLGFIDMDEFVVIKDGRDIGAFLSEYLAFPGVALHSYMYGSNGHKRRPGGPVIAEYTRRCEYPNRHVKCLIQPLHAARCRNSHCWFYKGMRHAVNEWKNSVCGSISLPPTACSAWINHYHQKSDQEYFEKASRRSVLDSVSMRFNNRSVERREAAELTHNAVFDESAFDYYLKRCDALSRTPILAKTLAKAPA